MEWFYSITSLLTEIYFLDRKTDILLKLNLKRSYKATCSFSKVLIFNLDKQHYSGKQIVIL